MVSINSNSKILDYFNYCIDYSLFFLFVFYKIEIKFKLNNIYIYLFF